MVIHTRLRRKSNDSEEPLWISNYIVKDSICYSDDINKSIKNVYTAYIKHGYIVNVMKYITKDALIEAYEHIKPYDVIDTTLLRTDLVINNKRDFYDYAPGIDLITKYEYSRNLDENINKLYESLKNGTYKHKATRRVEIPKGNGKVRPIGIACIEDKIVERAITDIILVPIYENIFEDSSYAYRTKRNCKMALEELEKTISNNNINYIIEADIKGYFDNVNHNKLIEMLKIIIKDKKLIKYLMGVLKVGYVDSNKKVHKTNRGTPQGGIVSPVLANIYLHYVLDEWIKSINLKGYYKLIRYADDFIILMELEEDSRKLLELVSSRFKQYGLTLSKEKTNVVEFGISSKNNLKYLGYTITRNKLTGGINKDIDISRLDKKIEKIVEILNKIPEDYTKYKEYKQVRLFYADYIRWINNILEGIYKYYKDTNDVNSNLIKLYNRVMDIVYEYLVNSPDMNEELLNECLYNIVAPYSFISFSPRKQEIDLGDND